MCKFRFGRRPATYGLCALFLLPMALRMSFGAPPESPLSPTEIPETGAPPAVSPAASSRTASSPPAPLVPAAGEALVPEAHYTVLVEGETARITCRVRVHVLRSPQAVLPVSFGEAAVGPLKVIKGKALLAGQGSGQFELRLSGTGNHELEWELLARVTAREKGAGLRFSGPPAALTTLEVTVPRAQQQIETSPPLIVTPAKSAPEKSAPSKTAAAESRLQGRLTSTAHISVMWRDRPPAPTSLKPLVVVQNRQRVQLEGNVVFRRAQLLCRLARGAVSELKVLVPQNERVLDVSASGDAFRGWRLAKEEDRQVVTLRFSPPLRRQTAIVVETRGTLPTGETLRLAGREEDGIPHGIHAEGVFRETGYVALSADAKQELVISPAKNWRPLSPAELPASLQSSGVRGFRYFQPGGLLSVRVQPVSPHWVVEQRARVFFESGWIRLHTEFTVTAERTAGTSLRMTLPGDVVVDRVGGTPVKSWKVDDSAKPSVLRVDFLPGRKRTFSFVVKAHQPLSVALHPVACELLLLRPRQVTEERARLWILSRPELRVTVDPAETSGWKPVSRPAEALPEDWHAVGFWQGDTERGRMKVRVHRAAAVVGARILSRIALSRDAMQVSTHLAYKVDGAPCRLFLFAAPAAAGETLTAASGDGRPVVLRRLKAAPQNGPPEKQQEKTNGETQGKPAQKEQQPAESNTESVSANAGGWVLWEARPLQPVQGEFTLVVHYRLPRAGTGSASSGKEAASEKETAWKFQPLRLLSRPAAEAAPRPLNRVRGEVLVHTQPGCFVRVESITGAIVPLSELPDRLSDQRPEQQEADKLPQLAFHHQDGPVSLTLAVVPLVRRQKANIVVSKALVEIGLSENTAADYRCRYQLRVQQQRRLRIDLPKTALPLAVLLNGRPVGLERWPTAQTAEGFSAHFVDLSPFVAGKSADGHSVPLTLLLQYRLPLTPPPFESSLGRLRLHFPHLADREGNDALVQKRRIAVWVPPNRALLPGGKRLQAASLLKLTGIGPQDVTSGDDGEGLEEWIAIPPAEHLSFPARGHVFRFESGGGENPLEVVSIDVGFATWALSLPIFLIGLVLARTSWPNKLGVVLLVGFAGTLAAVRWPSETWDVLLGARYGLAGVFLWWLGSGWMSLRQRHSSLPFKAPEKAAACSLPLCGLPAVVVPPPGSFEVSLRKSAAEEISGDVPGEEGGDAQNHNRAA